MHGAVLLDIAAYASAFLSIVVFLLTYLRAAINKSNRDIDQNTINSQKENITALTKERDMWKDRALDAEGQNKVLQNTVTAAPQIAELTAQVTKQHTANIKWQRQAAQFQTDLLREVKHFIESHDNQGASA